VPGVEPFQYLLRVRYSECDAQKVAFNARYGDYIDLAVTEFLRALGYGTALVDGGLDYQLVKQTIEWRGPARFDQVLAVAVHPVRVGTTSFALGSEFRVLGESRVFAQAETVYVLVDAASLEKRAVPDDLRDAVERGAPGTVIDHAGAGHGGGAPVEAATVRQPGS
jgi:acyl-CoA thioester hydrolase